ncbi:alpha/beta fold hydrolase [Spongisporangium articulatum]|uniref:Alpha/beta fold hydrolase n=1 Tax=Spongisporangium articulatum TaxID=3362603 RepID=A0ABW8AH43_9ACTN
MTTYAQAPDGVRLGYRTLGSGPGLVIVHGAMSTGANHSQLAEGLASRFTVHLLDRRGRGLSPAAGAEWSVEDDVADLRAVLAATGARRVFGISIGAIVALRTALVAPEVERLAIFEPPLFGESAHPTALLEKLDAALAAEDRPRALVIGMQGAELGPSFLNKAPTGLLVPMVKLGLRQERRTLAKQGPGPYVPMAELAPTLHHDFRIVAETSGRTAELAGLPQPTLLLGAQRSPAYMRAALDDLERTLPHAERVTLPDVAHEVTYNDDLRGKPQLVVEPLRGFFA